MFACEDLCRGILHVRKENSLITSQRGECATLSILLRVCHWQRRHFSPCASLPRGSPGWVAFKGGHLQCCTCKCRNLLLMPCVYPGALALVPMVKLLQSCLSVPRNDPPSRGAPRGIPCTPVGRGRLERNGKRAASNQH